MVSPVAFCMSSFLFLLFITDSGFGPPTRLRLRRGFSSVVESLNFSRVSFSCLEGSRREIWTWGNRTVITNGNNNTPFYCFYSQYVPLTPENKDMSCMISFVIPFCIILIRTVKEDIARFYTSRIRLKADLQLNQRENKVE